MLRTLCWKGAAFMVLHAVFRSDLAVCRQLALSCLFAGALAGVSPAAAVDLSKAVVVIPSDLSPQEKKAVALLVDEVAKRTQLRWSTATEWPKGDGAAVVAVGREAGLAKSFPRTAAALKRVAAPGGAEGYRVLTEQGPTVLVVGNDARGVLFGVGRLLRELRLERFAARLPAGFQEASAPKVPLRGHQLGYRPKTNSYDGWNLAQWEQYYRDLAVFGTNAIELIPPRSDDEPDSPLFPAPQLETMAGMSRLADEYGLDVWIWYPAMDEDYSKPETVEFALKEWEVVYQSLPRINDLFVPGGDPGHTHPKPLMNLLEKQAARLRKYHPEARLWVSPQGFSRDWLEEFIGMLNKDEPQWLDGLVFGPQQFYSLSDLRKLCPKRYPIRGYPDITHSLNCQHPVNDWDPAFAVTQGREVINPRPRAQAAIFRYYQPDTFGFVTYSEGCNDDVNKIVWSGLGWNPEAPLEELLRQYGRYFVGDRFAEGIAQGLLALEDNWKGPLLTNAGVERTLAQFQDMERAAAPFDLLNWRFQQLLYRAYYDAFVRERLIAETAQEAEARAVLRQARRLGSQAAMDRAEEILFRAKLSPAAEDLRARMNELAEALFQSVRMQLETERYKGQPGRGTSQNTIDVPLNDRLWFMERFASIRKLDAEQDRLRAIHELLHRADPGPGGFYDDLGNLANQPHLVRGVGFDLDPDFRRSSLLGCDYFRPGWNFAAMSYALAMWDAPLELRYSGLDPRATYRVRVTYGDEPMKIRLDADGQEVHPLLAKPGPNTPLEFDLPESVTSDGELTLSWRREPSRGGNGRGCQVREVWLIRKAD
jgi:hypothetical protein